MPDILGFWDRRADDPEYSHTTDSGCAIYRHNGKLVTYNERERLEARAKKEKCNTLEEAVYVSWEESESGWGVRPDGCSIHLTEQDYGNFLKNYWAGMPREVPSVYSRPAGSVVKIMVSPDLHQRIKNSEYGLRLYHEHQRELEKNQEIKFETKRTGWVPVTTK